MNLPNTPTPLVTYAAELNLVGMLKQFIDAGGGDFLCNAWIAYSVEELRKSELLNNMTPVAALDLGRCIFEDILRDFQEQLEYQKEDEAEKE